jgi:ribosomal protein L7/L12
VSAVNYQDIEVSDEVIAAVDAGRKIEAIKILREQVGLDLQEATDLIDGLAQYLLSAR